MALDSINESLHRDAAEIQADGAAVLNFVAHPDDDLLFLSPDLLHAIQAGRNVRTVYVTSGDSGLDALYWRDRESGVQAAYAEMAGVANSWIESDAGVAEHPIPVFTLTDQQNVSLAFMRLPDGDVNGAGFASNGHQSLKDLWTGSIATIEAVDGSSTYTLSMLTRTLSYLITSFQPKQVNTLNYRHAYGDRDHSDHHTVGYLTQSAMAHSDSSAPCIGYTGYPVIPLPANVSETDQKAKDSAFYTYAQYDKQVLNLLTEGSSTVYDSWLVRQYRVNQPLSLITHCRRRIWLWPWARRASVAYLKIRPLLVHLPFFETLRGMAMRHGDTPHQVIRDGFPDR
jgi:LmbE family N-acetylglucosaminyl deacetylase